MKTFKKTQKVRILIDGVGLFTTVKSIKEGMFSLARHNMAANIALATLETTRNSAGLADQCATGLSGEWVSTRVQLDLV